MREHAGSAKPCGHFHTCSI